jgi:hypothetical protein
MSHSPSAFAHRQGRLVWHYPTAVAMSKCRAWKRRRGGRPRHDEQKETQPPGRYGQGRLIELMEQNGLAPRPPATASSRTFMIGLYQTPVEPIETGVGMVEALNTYADPSPSRR